MPCRARLLEPQPEMARAYNSGAKEYSDGVDELELVEGKNRQVRRMTAISGASHLAQLPGCGLAILNWEI